MSGILIFLKGNTNFEIENGEVQFFFYTQNEGKIYFGPLQWVKFLHAKEIHHLTSWSVVCRKHDGTTNFPYNQLFHYNLHPSTVLQKCRNFLSVAMNIDEQKESLFIWG